MDSEVKGAWFVAARAWLEERQAVHVVANVLPGPIRETLLDPVASLWYPERIMQGALEGLRSSLAPSREQFVDAMDGCTVIGTSKFFRALLPLASPSFVLRQVPTMWKRIRRGPGEIAVDAEDGHARLLYSEFPYFDDENYRLLTEGSLRAVVRTCTGRQPTVTLTAWTADSLQVDIKWSP